MAGHPVIHRGDQHFAGWPDPRLFSMLKAYWDPDVYNVADGTALATHFDISGNGNDLAQATGANQPKVYNNVLNGHPVLRFDGTNDFMKKTFGSVLTQPNALVFVASWANFATDTLLFDAISSTAGQRSLLLTSTSQWNIYAGSYVGGSAGNASPHVFAVIFNGASSKLYVGGGSANASGDAGTGGMDGLTMGAAYQPGNYAQADFGGFAILSSSSLAVVNVIAKGFADKYALAWTTAT